MINLFEYQNKVAFPDPMEDLEGFLDEIWKNREKSGYYFEDQGKRQEAQQFLQFLHKTHEIKSNKYVGVIQYKGQRINLLPKIFFEPDKSYGEPDLSAMHKHVLWWLSYCRKIRFPNYQTSTGSLKSDFFEVLIYLFAKYTRELLTSTIYQQYEEIERELPFIKGRLNTSAYIRESLATGRWHKLQCDFDAFVMDNRFNRIVKHVATLLFHNTKSQDNKKHLHEILFVLDEVADVPARAEECANIRFNPIFSEFETVRDYCSLFLNHSVSFNYKNELKLFAFLLPMEYVFEDFIFGFIDKEIDGVEAISQSGSTYLDEGKSFSLRPDLLLEIGSRKVIADTKYKIIYSDEKDPKNGISQSDLYQMVAYAIRFEVSDIILFYPETFAQYQEDCFEIEIMDELANGEKIDIRSYQLPIINRSMFDQKLDENVGLRVLFNSTRIRLMQRIRDILTVSYIT